MKVILVLVGVLLFGMAQTKDVPSEEKWIYPKPEDIELSVNQDEGKSGIMKEFEAVHGYNGFNEVFLDVADPDTADGQSCKDEGEDCAIMKTNGYCESKSDRMKDTMEKNCRKTCGFCGCKDEGEDCTIMKANGYCESKSDRMKDTMKKNCRKTCGFCAAAEVQKVKNCKDVKDMVDGTKCKKWRDNGSCKESPRMMEKNCPRTCGFCKLDCKDVDEDRCQKSKDKCQTMEDVMKMSCPKTCGFCDCNDVKDADVKKCEEKAKKYCKSMIKKKRDAAEKLCPKTCGYCKTAA